METSTASTTRRKFQPPHTGVPEGQPFKRPIIEFSYKSDEKMDKDRFRRDLGNVMEAYENVLGRVKQNLA